MVKYQTHLDSDEWKQTRRSTMARVKSKSRRTVYHCEKCREFFHADAIEVHHKTYERVGREKKTDLAVLCRWCHAEIHGKSVSGIMVTDSKDVYRIRFEADRKSLSDGEMNYMRNEVINKLGGLDA